MSRSLSKFAGLVVLASALALPFAVSAQTVPVTGSTLSATVVAAPTTPLKVKKARPTSTTGTVTSVNGTVIAFTNAKSVAFTVDTSVGSVKLMRRYGASLVADTNIQTGDKITVVGTVGANNVITATSLRDLSLQARNGTFVGTVTAINGSSFTLASKARGNQTINTTSSTKFKETGVTTPSLSNLVVSETITVAGVWDRTNSKDTANTITIKVASTRVTGTVTAINGTTLTVTTGKNVVYTVDASKAAVTFKAGRKATLSIVAVNDTVAVVGSSVSGSTNVTAKTLRDSSKSYGALKVTGTVTSISGSTLTVTNSKNVVYTIDASKAKVTYKNGRKGTISIIQQNDTVTVGATGISGSTSFAATTVRDSSQTYKKPVVTSTTTVATPAATTTTQVSQ